MKEYFGYGVINHIKNNYVFKIIMIDKEFIMNRIELIKMRNAIDKILDKTAEGESWIQKK